MSENPSPKPGFLPQDRMLHETDRTDEVYSHAFAAAPSPTRRQARVQHALNIVYYGIIGIAIAWIFSLAIDRAPPVKTGQRKVMNPEKKVVQGTRLLVRSSRNRLQSCELTRRWAVIGGGGRR